MIPRASRRFSSKILLYLSVLESAQVLCGQASLVDRLVSKLNDPSACENRLVVPLQLGWIGDPRAVEPLIAVLKDPELIMREHAARALGMIGDPRAVDPLILLLKDNPCDNEVIDALGHLKDKRAVQPLMACKRGSDADNAINNINHPDQDAGPTRRAHVMPHAPRKIDANFVWPSWLPEYPSWYGARYNSDVKYGPGNSYRFVDAKQTVNEGKFEFNAPHTDVCDTDEGLESSVMSFYEAKLTAMGMTISRDHLGSGSALAVVATDGRRAVTIEPNGGSMLNGAVVEPPGLGVTISVEYFRCAGGATRGETVINPRASDTNTVGAKTPCPVPK